MSKFNGQLIILNLNGTPIGHELDCELSISQNLIDATTKDSANWKEEIRGTREASISCNGLVDYSSSFGVDQLADLIISAESANFVFATTDVGDTKYSGEVNLSDLSQSMSNDDVASWSGTLSVTGVLVKETIV